MGEVSSRGRGGGIKWLGEVSSRGGGGGGGWRGGGKWLGRSIVGEGGSVWGGQ